jgi:hypothetical protein
MVARRLESKGKGKGKKKFLGGLLYPGNKSLMPLINGTMVMAV